MAKHRKAKELAQARKAAKDRNRTHEQMLNRMGELSGMIDKINGWRQSNLQFVAGRGGKRSTVKLYATAMDELHVIAIQFFAKPTKLAKTVTKQMKLPIAA